MIENKVYLGDGVYASFDGFHIRLAVNDGIEDTDNIALDPKVFENLIRFSKTVYDVNQLQLMFLKVD